MCIRAMFQCSQAHTHSLGFLSSAQIREVLSKQMQSVPTPMERAISNDPAGIRPFLNALGTSHSAVTEKAHIYLNTFLLLPLSKYP